MSSAILDPQQGLKHPETARCLYFDHAHSFLEAIWKKSLGHPPGFLASPRIYPGYSMAAALFSRKKAAFDLTYSQVGVCSLWLMEDAFDFRLRARA